MLTHSHSETHHHKLNRSNSVSVRLTESAVFLRTDGIPTRRGDTADTRNSMVRGLLVLDLVKPTKLTSIEVELTAITSTAWPEGIGARRIDVTEDHRVFRATTTYLNAGKSQSATRRAASVGPGILYPNPNALEYEGGDLEDDFEDSEWHDVGGELLVPHLQVTDPGAHLSRSRGGSRFRGDNGDNSNPHERPSSEDHQQSQSNHQLLQTGDSSSDPNIASTIGSTSSNPTTRPSVNTRTRPNRRVSIDYGQFHRRTPFSHSYETYQEGLSGEAITEQWAQQLAPIPPYSALPSPPMSQTESTHSETYLEGSHGQTDVQGPAQSLEEFRRSLFQLHSPSQTSLSPTLGSAFSLPLSQHLERSLSRHTSVAIPIPENGELEDTTPTQRHSTENHPIQRVSSSHRTTSPLRGLPPLSRSPVNPPSPLPIDSRSATSSSSPTIHSTSPSSPNHTNTDRERRLSRFSLAELSNMFMDVVRPSRSKTGSSIERTAIRGREPSVDSSIGHRGHRGRTMERGSVSGNMDETTGTEEDSPSVKESKENRRNIFEKILKDTDHKHKPEGWVEFKKGVYTYPISFTIPSNAPPTMQCDFGSVSWRLKANVHRPGAFKPKMTASREVITISCPTEEDTEDTENIIVERQWEQQLQYLISISGRSFYIGGTVPVTFTFMPLTKMKIHRLSVYIEGKFSVELLPSSLSNSPNVTERVDYYTNMRRIARTDPLTRFTLLSIKGEGKGADPILPLDSDSPDALRNSPLNALIDTTLTDDELSETASNLMGPGPWTFHQDLKLPKSCDAMHFTNKNRRGNITVSHMLKVVIRVERGDDVQMDAKTGKRKLFDIVVQTPVLILSCRCNPEWTSLPRYAAVFDDSQAITPSCPCKVALAKAQAEVFSLRNNSMSAALERITSRHSSDSSSASAAETSPVSPPTILSLRQMNHHDSLLRSNSLYERLMSGQETESGEAPPAYDTASSSTSHHCLTTPSEVVVNS